MTRIVSCPLMAMMILMAASAARCATKDLGDGFRDRGAATLSVGGDILDGRMYFVSGLHLCSWEVTK